MPKSLTVFCETLDDNLQWQADNAYTFQMVTTPGVPEWPEMLSNYMETNAALNGLLAMGIDKSYPFSFAQRSFPKNASAQVTAMFCENSSVEAVSWLTYEELQQKVGELMIIPDQLALTVRPHLARMLEELPAPTKDPKNHRIVFWFN